MAKGGDPTRARARWKRTRPQHAESRCGRLEVAGTLLGGQRDLTQLLEVARARLPVEQVADGHEQLFVGLGITHRQAHGARDVAGHADDSRREAAVHLARNLRGVVHFDEDPGPNRWHGAEPGDGGQSREEALALLVHLESPRCGLWPGRDGVAGPTATTPVHDPGAPYLVLGGGSSTIPGLCTSRGTPIDPSRMGPSPPYWTFEPRSGFARPYGRA